MRIYTFTFSTFNSPDINFSKSAADDNTAGNDRYDRPHDRSAEKAGRRYGRIRPAALDRDPVHSGAAGRDPDDRPGAERKRGEGQQRNSGAADPFDHSAGGPDPCQRFPPG